MNQAALLSALAAIDAKVQQLSTENQALKAAVEAAKEVNPDVEALVNKMQTDLQITPANPDTPA